RGRRVRQQPPCAGPAPLRALPVLRPRWSRHRRALPRVGAQVRRARAGGLPLALRSRRFGRRRRVTDQLALFGEAAAAHATDAIRTRLDVTMVVEAGAGTGKTRALVERVVALVGAGIPMQNIAAITFTEKAAGELRDRIRRALQERGETAAVEQLDAAAICTL